jgi:hypothetical protein
MYNMQNNYDTLYLKVKPIIHTHNEVGSAIIIR